MLFLKNIGPFQLILSMDMQTYMEIRPFLGTCVWVCVFMYIVYTNIHICAHATFLTYAILYSLVFQSMS